MQQQFQVLRVIITYDQLHEITYNGIDLLRELAKVTTAIETIVDDAPVMEKITKEFVIHRTTNKESISSRF
jgi:hypothetical protein